MFFKGLSDPFVSVELLPSRLFSTSQSQSTQVQKATLNPVFDECFEFAASASECSEAAAMIRFSVFDHDVLSFNDFGGEAFLSLNTIPGIAQDDDGSSNLRGLKQIQLPLAFQEHKGKLT